MADEEHLRILREGVDRWNQWRQDKPEEKPDLSNADLSGLHFSEINFQKTDLTRSDLSNTNLSKAKLSHARLNLAIVMQADLTKAKLIRASLHGIKLIEAKLQEANLTGSNLEFSILNDSNFENATLHLGYLVLADISYANFSKADLIEADLYGVRALGTVFCGANLTGACIENWQINGANLDKVNCDYVYFKQNEQERRPSDRTTNSAPGDFARLVRKSLETVDLIFSNGIDWKAFALSLEDLRAEYEEQELSIQAIENKNDAFVIRLNVPPDADKGAIERREMELYKMQLSALEAQYRSELQAKDREIASYLRENTNLWELIKLRASQPVNNYINVEANAVADNESEIIHQHGKGDNFAGDRIQGNKMIGDRDETSER